jgi:hypothetical protein
MLNPLFPAPRTGTRPFTRPARAATTRGLRKSRPSTHLSPIVSPKHPLPCRMACSGIPISSRDSPSISCSKTTRNNNAYCWNGNARNWRRWAFPLMIAYYSIRFLVTDPSTPPCLLARTQRLRMRATLGHLPSRKKVLRGRP